MFFLSHFSCTAFYFPWKKVGIHTTTQKAADADPSLYNASFYAALTAEILLLVLVIYRLKTKRRNAFTSTHTNRMPLLQNFLSFWHAGNMLQIEEEFSISEQIFSLIPPKIFNRIATQF